MNYQPLSISLPQHAHRALKLAAVAQNTSMQRLILDALDFRYPALKVHAQTPPPDNYWFPDMSLTK